MTSINQQAAAWRAMRHGLVTARRKLAAHLARRHAQAHGLTLRSQLDARNGPWRHHDAMTVAYAVRASYRIEVDRLMAL